MDAIKKYFASQGKAVIVASMGRCGSTYFQKEISKQFWMHNKGYNLSKSSSTFVQIGAWYPETFEPLVDKQIVYKTHSKFDQKFEPIPLKIYVYGEIEHCILSTYRLAVTNPNWWRQHLKHFGCDYSPPDSLLSADPLDLIYNIKSWLNRENVVFISLSDGGVEKLNKSMLNVFPDWKPITFVRKARDTDLDTRKIDPSSRLVSTWKNEIQPLLVGI